MLIEYYDNRDEHGNITHRSVYIDRIFIGNARNRHDLFTLLYFTFISDNYKWSKYEASRVAFEQI